MELKWPLGTSGEPWRILLEQTAFSFGTVAAEIGLFVLKREQLFRLLSSNSGLFPLDLLLPLSPVTTINVSRY